MNFIFDPSLVLYLPLYRLDGASLMSHDVYGHLGTNYGSVWTPRGRSFDGVDDFIDFGIVPSLDLVSAGTVEIWILPTPNVNRSGIIGRFITTGSETGERYAIDCAGVSPYNYRFIISDGTSTNIATVAQSDVTPTANRTEHIVGTFDGIAVKAYVNGRLLASVAQTLTPVMGNTPLYIGKDGGQWGKFRGIVGEARLYNRALTPQGVLRNYLATKWRYR